MPQILSMTPQPLDMVRMDFNDYSKAADPASSLGPLPLPSLNTFVGSMRRRSGSIGAPYTSHEDLETLRVNTANSLNPEVHRDICICTPEPKIPRPRNAFILYRQHHQSQVTTDNPRLSNPEISKIIGERWKNEDPDIKDSWKRMADQEKLRHQSQYPNYRYQPRRGGKSQSWSGSTSTDDQGRCPKCNGRFASSTPRTPATPFGHQIASTTNFQDSQERPNLHRLNTSIPRGTSVDLSPTNRQPFPGPHLQFRSPDSDPTSPAAKRRRINGMDDYRLDSGRRDSYGGVPFEESTRGPIQQPSYQQVTALPEPASSRNFPMYPPPRPSNSWAWSEHDNRGNQSNTFDESLRLPPLKQSMSPSWSLPIIGEDRRRNAATREVISPARSSNNAKDMKSEIMEIPVAEKMKIIKTVCQPVLPSLFEGPLTPTRGALITIEGSDAGMAREVGLVLERGLMSCEWIRLKVWDESSISPAMLYRREAPRLSDDFTSCFQAIRPYRELSKEVVEYVTSNDGSRSDTNQPGENDPMNKGKSKVDNSNHGVEVIPVALISDGFSLTLSDRLACTTPSTDHFSPFDHWRWMASLCRGIHSPDLVICVQACDENETGGYGKLELQRPGLVVVGVPVGKELDEGTKRRLVFEVIEWMRGSSTNRAMLDKR
ncbi:Repressor of filamentous growth 1 [Cladobotryum mycophilum]|uniref:Repressor of filamentous growth 1 n=1 Tax=Cladobotryum mycophilum TaxID=491253 RepID=A0ABR0SY83_9HYPO